MRSYGIADTAGRGVGILEGKMTIVIFMVGIVLGVLIADWAWRKRIEMWSGE